MANNKKKKNSTAPKGATTKKGTKTSKPASKKAVRKPLSRRTKIAILCVSLAVLLVAGIVIGTIVYLNNRPFNYYKEDISKHISIDPSAYKDFTVTMKLDAITEQSIDERINQILNENKPTTALNSGKSDRNTEIKVGDIVTIFYRGYYFDENENRVEFDGGCNIQYSSGKVTPTTLTIGSGAYFSGFETNLIGKIPEQYANLTPVVEGYVEEGDVVYVQMTAVLPGNRSFTNKTVRIDLSDPDLEKEWGIGFKEYLIGRELRQNDPSPAPFTLPEAVDGQELVYYTNVKPMFKSADENDLDPIVVEAYCPIDYTNAPDLAGKTVYFEVYVRGTVHYDTPTLTESFIRDTLKLTDEDLEKFEGDDILTKFRGYVREELMNGYKSGSNTYPGYQSSYDDLLNDLIMDKINEITKIIRIPKRAIQPVYEQYIDSLIADYEYYKNTYDYSSVEQYMMDATGTKTVTEADEMVWYLAANAVKEQMAIFLIAQQQGLLADEATLKAEAETLFQNVVQSYIDTYYAETFAKYTTEEEYNKAYNELATNLRAQYTEELLLENAVYERVFAYLRTCPTVNLVGRGQ